jgi:Pentapeptide repeats (9 copies)
MAMQFTQGVNFNGAVFHGEARFIGAQFGAGSTFIKTVFHDKADFSASSWEKIAMLYTFVAGRNVGLKKAQEIAKEFDVSPKEMNEISFDGAHFYNEAIFKGRKFLGSNSFGRTKAYGNLIFKIPPNFHDCEISSDFSFEFALFPKANGAKISAQSYRALKLAFSQKQAINEEQRFFRLEISEEAAGAKTLRKYVYCAYALFSNYGFGLLRPLLLGLSSLAVCGFIYGVIANLSFCLPFLMSCSLSTDWASFSILQALPLPGLDKLSDAASATLFGKGFSSLWLTATVIFHKAISLLALFLIGLGLRNLFKLK